VIASAFAGVNFFFGFFVGHAGIDALEDLALGQAGVFEAGNFGAGHDRLVTQMALKNELHGRVGKAEELESDSVDADGIELIGAGDIEDLGLGKSRADEIGGRVRAGKEMLVHVRRADELDAGVIADSRVLELDDLRDLRVGDVESFELLDIAGKHASGVERAIVRERVLVAASGCEEAGAGGEKQSSLMLHIPIVGGREAETGTCAWVIPG
jgi:hypothetical protein